MAFNNSIKIPFFYFILVFSVVIILLSPFYIRAGKAKPLNWMLTSLFVSIIISLIYVIYIMGGFNV